MSYVNQNLLSDEKVVYSGKLSSFIFILPSLFLLVSLPYLFYGPVILFGLLALPMVFAIMRYNTTELALTNKRIIAKVGVISRRTVELNLSKVESLRVDQGIFGRMMNFGTLTINGTGGVHTPIKFISEPLAFRRQLNEQVEKVSNTSPQSVSEEKVA